MKVKNAYFFHLTSFLRNVELYRGEKNNKTWNRYRNKLKNRHFFSFNFFYNRIEWKFLLTRWLAKFNWWSSSYNWIYRFNLITTKPLCYSSPAVQNQGSQSEISFKLLIFNFFSHFLLSLNGFEIIVKFLKLSYFPFPDLQILLL